MNNERKLELTLCCMLPYGLKGTTFYSDTDTEPCTLCYSDGINNQADIASWLFGTYKTLPHLHSLDKLTEPILEGGLIPIVELAKMENSNINWVIENDKCVGRENVGVTLWFDIVDEVPFVKEIHNNIFGELKDDDYSDMYMSKVLPSQISEKLKEMHLNIYNLPSDMYVEKSTVNI